MTAYDTPLYRLEVRFTDMPTCRDWTRSIYCAHAMDWPRAVKAWHTAQKTMVIDPAAVHRLVPR